MQSLACAESRGLLKLSLKLEDQLQCECQLWWHGLFALVAEELALLQSEALWPTPPQYMQRLLVKQCCYPCWVSLPSFVRALEMADLAGVEVLEDLLDLSLEFCCCCWGLVVVDCSWLLLDWLDLSEQDFSQSHSQWQALIECVRFFDSVRVEGLPTWPMMSSGWNWHCIWLYSGYHAF